MNKKYIQEKGIKKEKQSHFTNIEMVKDLLNKYPLPIKDSILDAGSGINKVWYDNIKNKDKDWVEIELGKDFFDYNKKVDWIIGNPPYHKFVDFLFKSLEIAKKGICFLISSDKIIHFTTKRLNFMKEKGFFINKIVVVNDCRWFGRYYYLIITKEDNGLFDFIDKNYSKEVKQEAMQSEARHSSQA